MEGPALFVFIDLDNLVFNENAKDLPRFRERVTWINTHLPGKKLWFSNETNARILEKEGIDVNGRVYVSPDEKEMADHALVAKIAQTFRHAPETPTAWIITHDLILRKLIRYMVYPHRNYIHYADFNERNQLQRAATVDFHFETRFQLQKFIDTLTLLRVRVLDKNAEDLVKKQKGAGARKLSRKK